MNACGPRIPEQVGNKWETDGKQMGDKYERMRPKDPRAGGKQVGDRWETNGRQV